MRVLLKKRQKDIYEFIKDFLNEKHYSPTVREIGKAVGISSTSTVHGHLERLRKKGYIDYVNTSPRTLRIIN